MQKVDYCVHESDTYLGVARTMLSDDAVHFETFSRMRFTTKINASNLDGLVLSRVWPLISARLWNFKDGGS